MKKDRRSRRSEGQRREDTNRRWYSEAQSQRQQGESEANEEEVQDIVTRNIGGETQDSERMRMYIEVEGDRR